MSSENVEEQPKNTKSTLRSFKWSTSRSIDENEKTHNAEHPPLPKTREELKACFSEQASKLAEKQQVLSSASLPKVTKKNSWGASNQKGSGWKNSATESIKRDLLISQLREDVADLKRRIDVLETLVVDLKTKKE